MKIDNYFQWVCIGLEDYFFPDVYCPNCNSKLLYKWDSMSKEETPRSTPDSRDYIVTCKFLCEKCSEPVIMTGVGYSENQVIVYDDKDYNKDKILYCPCYFMPTIHLFKIHPKCPSEVTEKIIKSFSLFWNDMDSCVNKLRQSVELLMDSQRINKTAASPNGNRSTRKLTLHNRIDLFKKKNQKVGELLEAIKWIGNKGSHADKQLWVNEVIAAYEILEHALNELYEPPARDVIHEMAKRINKRKGSYGR